MFPKHHGAGLRPQLPPNGLTFLLPSPVSSICFGDKIVMYKSHDLKGVATLVPGLYYPGLDAMVPRAARLRGGSSGRVNAVRQPIAARRPAYAHY